MSLSWAALLSTAGVITHLCGGEGFPFFYFLLFFFVFSSYSIALFSLLPLLYFVLPIFHGIYYLLLFNFVLIFKYFVSGFLSFSFLFTVVVVELVYEFEEEKQRVLTTTHEQLKNQHKTTTIATCI